MYVDLLTVERDQDCSDVGAQRIDAKDLPLLLSSSITEAKLGDSAFFFVLPSDSTFFSSASQSSRSNRRGQHSKKHIPRPKNAFFCFRSQYVETHKGAGPANQQNELSKAAASVWSGMSRTEKQVFMDQALRERQVHKEKYPDYVFQPIRRGRAKAKKARNGGLVRNASSLSSAAVKLANGSSDESPSSTSAAVYPTGARSSSPFPSSTSSSMPDGWATQEMGDAFSASSSPCFLPFAQAQVPEGFDFRWDSLDLCPAIQHTADEPKVRFS